MGRYCDVISINAYAASSQVDPARGVPSTMSAHFTELSEVTGRPLLNSEWYPNVAEVPIFRRYQSFMIAHPAFVGSQFFNWAGHKELSYTVRTDDGRSTYQPKPELEAVAAEVHAKIGLLRTEGKPGTGSPEPNKTKVGTVNRESIKRIAEIKMEDLNANDIEAAMLIIEGSARSMGLTVIE